ncbi:PTS system mannose/fructose/N-acetylgalactosamine-transporter subunit IIB [Lacticaseibacillus hegangensis]|uniref:PTS system mannose/fructose/N-acetylgalactosamine-transporter subunit IIB n=1 Tax=Lacticaseibacillus hegangensis TaxID=2486010 RepID=A0ABW4CVE3_9LACO|nr:PTS sugar transporter subunit IIB [Lacticaseibacillus hegangensis]
MAIIAARIDGRLVHGQVANLWTTKLGPTRIIVVDDAAAKSDVEKGGLRMATPDGVRLSVLDTERAAKQILDHRYDSQKVFLVAKRPETYLALVKAGVPIKEINVGNMSQTDETRSITKSINVVDADVETFEELDSLGVHLVAQMVPGDPAADFMSLLKKDRRSEQ